MKSSTALLRLKRSSVVLLAIHCSQICRVSSSPRSPVHLSRMLHMKLTTSLSLGLYIPSMAQGSMYSLAAVFQLTQCSPSVLVLGFQLTRWLMFLKAFSQFFVTMGIVRTEQRRV